MNELTHFDVFIGCEESGTVRDAFIRRGISAVSCDLIPSRSPGPHLQMDIVQAVKMGGRLAILHPDCTKIAVSGNRWWAGTKERIEAMNWTVALFNLACEYFESVALENPIGSMSSYWRKPDQIIQPWMFGHPETKATCLWTRNLPRLEPTDIVDGREQRVWKMGPGPNRKRDRSITFTGVAGAMAQQWSPQSILAPSPMK